MDWLSSSTPLIISHRGASAIAPENTLAAFSLARELGADGIEFDVQLTADGQPIVIHDASVERTTNGFGEVAEMTLAQLKELDAGDGQTLPTLDEVFELLGASMLYNIELKGLSRRENGLEAAVANRIRSHQLEVQTLISSFNPWAVRRACRYMSENTLVALLRVPGWRRYTYLLAGSHRADHPHYSMVNEAYMRWAKRRGYRVHVWTVDDSQVGRRLARLGVHAIITNRPDEMRKALADSRST